MMAGQVLYGQSVGEQVVPEDSHEVTHLPIGRVSLWNADTASGENIRRAFHNRERWRRASRTAG